MARPIDVELSEICAANPLVLDFIRDFELVLVLDYEEPLRNVFPRPEPISEEEKQRFFRKVEFGAPIKQLELW